ncbi:MAG: hypothetical protein JW795_17965 [Chitinivibrionales bacterium]|nr:hypothetical protein [Chitinivibrionales bacterium]
MTLILVDISSSDTKTAVINAYKQKANITPSFPIVLYNDGGKKMADLFGSPNSGGPTWVVHPTRKYTQTAYDEATLSKNIDAALKDNCKPTSIEQKGTPSFSSSYLAWTLSKELRVLSPLNQEVTLSLVTLTGRNALQKHQMLSRGMSTIDLGKTSLSQGMYLLTIRNAFGIQYRSKVTF